MFGPTRQRLAELVGTTYRQAHEYEVDLDCFFEGLEEDEPARPQLH